MWSKRIYSYEELILEYLCFDDHAIIPHSYALAVVNEFGGMSLGLYIYYIY
jgi:hypothetical protein